jgi:hypothetical protein
MVLDQTLRINMVRHLSPMLHGMAMTLWLIYSWSMVLDQILRSTLARHDYAAEYGLTSGFVR